MSYSEKWKIQTNEIMKCQRCSHEIRSVFMDNGTEGQSISEGRRHVCNIHIIVTFTLVPAPVLQSF